jgi:Ca-activated chloride channel homolog
MIRILLCLIVILQPLYGVTISEYLANRSGIRAYKMGDYQTSVENFSEALSDGSESSEVYNNIGQVFYESNDYKQAEKLFMTSLSTAEDAKKPDVLYHLGNTAVKKEDYGSALGYYKQALMLNPNHEEAKRNFEYAFRLQEQQQQQEQESDESKDGDDDKQEKQQSEKQDDQDDQGDDKDETQGAEQTEEEKKQELTEQMLEFLSDKEQDAREKYKKKPVLEATVEKDW